MTESNGMIDTQWAQQFAVEWIAAWNAHDLDRILAHYTEDFEMTSPLIIQRNLDASGTLKGKPAIRAYWQKGLAAAPSLRFDLIQTLIGVNSLTLYYRRETGRLAAEVLVFNPAGLVVKGMAHHGA